MIKNVFLPIFAFLCSTVFLSAQTVMTPKWLPNKLQSRSEIPEVDDFIKSINGRVRLLHTRYDEAQLLAARSFTNGRLVLPDEVWEADIDFSSVGIEGTAMDVDINFRLRSGAAKEVGVAVAFDFLDWDLENYVMLPASVYNGNRCEIVDRDYAAGLDRKFLYKKDIPLMSVPIPQLAFKNEGVSRLEVNASNMATPAMCFLNKDRGKGFILLASQNTPYGDNGFIVEESADRTKATFVVSAPGVREKKPLFVGFEDSVDRGADLMEGDSLSIKLRIYSFDAKDIPGLLDKFMSVRKEVTGPNAPRNLVPFSQIGQWMTQWIDDRWYEGDDFQFYCPENARWISFGWIGGLMNTFPMLALGDEFHLNRVVKTFDFAIPRGQGFSGYFYGALNYDGLPFGREGYDDLPEIVLTRKNADVLFWMIKQFMLLKAQGKASVIRPEWEDNINRLATAFVKTWKAHGQWGNFLNADTGEVAVYNTTSGALAPGGLALASKYYNRPEYLRVAMEAANFYFQRDFVETGQTTGGCADILQNADVESTYALAQSLMTLYEITRDVSWLDKARQLSNLFGSWTTSYDYELPKETELGRNGAKLAGTVWASTQNKHGAPGVCTASSDVLFKVYRAQGDSRYAELLHDIISAHGESIRPGGYTNERLTYCDAEPFSVGNRGDHVTGWNELNGFLMALEIPGIYLTTNAEKFYVFDNIEAEIVEKNTEGLTLRIINPTAFDADITILAETADESKVPLGYTSFLNWPRISVPKGQSKMVKINKKGGIIP